MKKTMGVIAAMAIGSSLLAAPAHAEFRWPWEKAKKSPKPAATAQPTAQPTAAQQQGTALPQEEAFLQKLHEVNLKEVALGELALKKTQDAAIKEYATMLVNDHRQADAMVKAHVQKMGWRLEEKQARLPSGIINVPGRSQPGVEAAPEIAKLQALSGESFDKEFLRTMVEGHDALIPELAAFKEQEGDRAFHAELVTLFDTIKKHRKQAKAMLDGDRQDVGGHDDHD